MEQNITRIEEIGKNQRNEKLIRNDFMKGEEGVNEYNENHPSAKMSDNAIGKGSDSDLESYFIPGGKNQGIKPIIDSENGGGSIDRNRRKWGMMTNKYSSTKQYGIESIEIDEIADIAYTK